MSTISRSRTRQGRHPCDNFLYGFKGTPSGRASRAELGPITGMTGAETADQNVMRQKIAARRGTGSGGDRRSRGAAALPAASALGRAPGAGNCRHRPARPAPDARRDPPQRAPHQHRQPRPGEPSSSARDRATEPRSLSRSYVLASLRALHLDSDLRRLKSAPIRRTGGECAGVPQTCHTGRQKGAPRDAHAQSNRRRTCQWAGRDRSPRFPSKQPVGGSSPSRRAM